MIVQSKYKRKFKEGDKVLYKGKYPATIMQYVTMNVVKIKFDKPEDLPEHYGQKDKSILWTVEKYLTAEGPKGDPSWKDIWDNN